MARIEETTFRAVGATTARMPGPTAVLAAGFAAAEQTALRGLMDGHALADVPLVTITADTLDRALQALAELPDGAGRGVEAKLPHTLVMSGLQERQLHALMVAYRASELPRPMWATVTPVSANWSAKYLLIELLKEREALREARTR